VHACFPHPFNAEQQAVTLRGECLCGDIRFRLNGNPLDAGACHCRQCQRWSGPYWSSVSVRQDELVIENGSESIAWYPSSDHAERGFCVICGSSLFWRMTGEGAEAVGVSIGALEQPTGLTLTYHLHTDSAGDTYEVPKDAQGFESGELP
jgi:hypothetical protein